MWPTPSLVSAVRAYLDHVVNDVGAGGEARGLGVRAGRVADLGGTAVRVTGPGQGTEWELTVPRP